MTLFRRSMAALFGALVLACLPARNSWAETDEFRISRQPSILYLQQVLMEDQKLIEKHAARMGLPDLRVRWLTLTSGGTSVDSMLAGNIDIVTSGVSNLLLAWGKTNGAIKGVGAVAGLPLVLVTRNPNVKTIADFGPGDRIAVPTLKVSMQATIFGIALEKLYGPGGHSKLDALQVQIGHPDATLAVLNPSHEINSHFSAPPYYNIALKGAGVHAVLNSTDVLGGPATITASFATQKFVDDNPIKTKAFIAALDEASEMIAKTPERAADIYLAMTKEKISRDELVGLITDKGSIFSAAPQRTMIYADYMYKIGLIKLQAKTWTDYFIAPIHDRPGS